MSVASACCGKSEENAGEFVPFENGHPADALPAYKLRWW